MIRLESLTLRAVVVCPDDKSARCTREGETEEKNKKEVYRLQKVKLLFRTVVSLCCVSCFVFVVLCWLV